MIWTKVWTKPLAEPKGKPSMSKYFNKKKSGHDYIQGWVEKAEKDVLNMPENDFCCLHEEYHGDCIVKSVAAWRTNLDDKPPKNHWWKFWGKRYE